MSDRKSYVIEDESAKKYIILNSTVLMIIIG